MYSLESYALFFLSKKVFHLQSQITLQIWNLIEKYFWVQDRFRRWKHRSQQSHGMVALRLHDELHYLNLENTFSLDSVFNSQYVHIVFAP
jgi:hypothetical protein